MFKAALISVLAVLLAGSLFGPLSSLAQARGGDVVSLNLCTDELLVTLAPQRVLALSPLARDPALSIVAEAATHFRWVRPEAEAVLALHPALVLASPYGAQTTVTLLRARGIRVVTLSDPTDLAGVDRQLIDAGATLDASGQAGAWRAEFHARLAAIHPQRHPSAVLWEAHGVSAGPGSFGDSVLAAAGTINVGTGGAMDIETLARRHPAMLITEAAPNYPSLATDMLFHPALAGIARRTIAPAWLACPGPWAIAAVEAIAK